MDGLVGFMRSAQGRALKMLLGVAMISYGFLAEQSVIIGLLGFVPVIAGGLNACLFAPLFGFTVWGERKSKLAH